MSTIHALTAGRPVEFGINGILAPPLILIVLLLTGDPTVMGDAVNSRIVAFLGWLTFAVMVVAALGLFLAS